MSRYGEGKDNTNHGTSFSVPDFTQWILHSYTFFFLQVNKGNNTVDTEHTHTRARTHFWIKNVSRKSICSRSTVIEVTEPPRSSDNKSQSRRKPDFRSRLIKNFLRKPVETTQAKYGKNVEKECFYSSSIK